MRYISYKFIFTTIKFIFLFLFLYQAFDQNAFGQETFNKNEFAARRAKLIEKLEGGVAVIFGAEEHPHAVKFRQSPDFYYLTGIEEPASVLVIDAGRKQSFVFAPKRSLQKLAAEGPGIREMTKAEEFYGLAVLPLENFYTRFHRINGNNKKLFVQLTPPDYLQYARFEVLNNENEQMENLIFARQTDVRRMINNLKSWKPELELRDVSPVLDDLRWVKTPYEIERLRKSGQIAAAGVKEAIKGTKPGMFEYEIEAAARFVYTKMGARGDAFTPIVASGPNTLIFHYTANNRRMQAGEVVLIDYGADYEYYTSDITRTWAVSGRFTPDQEKMYRCILEARNVVIGMMKPGITVKDMQDAAEKVYQKHGFHREFLDFGRYIGHFVGISVHDPGNVVSDLKPFVPGVVFNVEPLIQNNEKRIHMRLEDTVLITENGAENLTRAAPAEIEEIYALIRQQPIGFSR